MFDRKALQAFSRNLTVAAGGLEADRRRELRRLAEGERAKVLREQKQRSGHTPTDAAIVDGRRGAPIAQAEQLVVLEFGYLREVAAAVLRAVIAASPHRSGDFARGFVMMVDGQETENLGAITDATREVVIVNTRPFARRLEIGKRKDGSPFVISAQPKFMERTTIALRARFGNVAKLWFNYFDISSPYRLKGGHGGRHVAYKQDRRSSGHRAGAAGRTVGASVRGGTVRYPGIRIVRL